MDFSIVESFVRPDPVYTTTRSDDASSVSFSDILQERISAPAAKESRSETDRSVKAKPVDAPAEKPARSDAEPADTRQAAPEKPVQEAATKDDAAADTQESKTPDDATVAKDAPPAETGEEVA